MSQVKRLKIGVGLSLVTTLPKELITHVLSWVMNHGTLNKLFAIMYNRITRTCTSFRDAVDWRLVLPKHVWTWTGPAVPDVLRPIFAEAVRWNGYLTKGTSSDLATISSLRCRRVVKLGFGRCAHLFDVFEVLTAARHRHETLRMYEAMIEERENKRRQRETNMREREQREVAVKRLLTDMGDTQHRYVNLSKAKGYIRSGSWSLEAIREQSEPHVARDLESERLRQERRAQVVEVLRACGHQVTGAKALRYMNKGIGTTLDDVREEAEVVRRRLAIESATGIVNGHTHDPVLVRHVRDGNEDAAVVVAAVENVRCRHEWNSRIRRDTLETALAAVGLELRPDSRFCEAYIRKTTVASLDEVVAVMRLTAWLFAVHAWRRHHHEKECRLRAMMHDATVDTWAEAVDRVIQEGIPQGGDVHEDDSHDAW
jgi:hypothetical protein